MAIGSLCLSDGMGKGVNANGYFVTLIPPAETQLLILGGLREVETVKLYCKEGITVESLSLWVDLVFEILARFACKL